MDEHVGLVGGDRQRLARRRVAGEHDLAALALAAPMTCSGRTPPTVSPALETPEVRPGLDAEALRAASGRDGPGAVLDEHVAEATRSPVV